MKATKNGRNITPQNSGLQMKNIAFPGGFDITQPIMKPIQTSAVQSERRSRAISPFPRKHSPPRSTTPTPTGTGLSFSKTILDSLKKTNDLLNQEILRLRAEVDSLRQFSARQELELQKFEKKAQEAMELAAEETAKSKAAKEVIKSLTSQLKEMAERLPHGAYKTNTLRSAYNSNGLVSHTTQHSDLTPGHSKGSDAANDMDMETPTFRTARVSEFSDQHLVRKESVAADELINHTSSKSNQFEEELKNQPISNREVARTATKKENLDSRVSSSFQNGDNESIPRNHGSSNQVEAEWIEQFEPGVYITLIALRDGTRDLKRVRFSRRKFGEQQAEAWWSENRYRVYQKYNFRASDRASSAVST